MEILQLIERVVLKTEERQLPGQVLSNGRTTTEQKKEGEKFREWIDRFGNYAQAIRPLERLLELK